MSTFGPVSGPSFAGRSLQWTRWLCKCTYMEWK